MAKVTFEFDMYEDREDMEIMTRAHDLHGQAHQFKEWLKTEVKHGQYDKKTTATLEWIYQQYNKHFEGLLD